jgi:hypothetical protein
MGVGVPSASPSGVPSASPSDVPSQIPSVSHAPSMSPSDVPSAAPSTRPSSEPSSAPSLTATNFKEVTMTATVTGDFYSETEDDVCNFSVCAICEMIGFNMALKEKLRDCEVMFCSAVDDYGDDYYYGDDEHYRRLTLTDPSSFASRELLNAVHLTVSLELSLKFASFDNTDPTTSVNDLMHAIESETPWFEAAFIAAAAADRSNSIVSNGAQVSSVPESSSLSSLSTKFLIAAGGVAGLATIIGIFGLMAKTEKRRRKIEATRRRSLDQLCFEAIAVSAKVEATRRRSLEQLCFEDVAVSVSSMRIGGDGMLTIAPTGTEKGDLEDYKL